MIKPTAPALLLIAGGAVAATLDVPGDYATIQAAIDAANPGDLIAVAAGTYTGPGNEELDFHGKDLFLRSAAGPQATVIDCAGDGRAFYIHSGETRAAEVAGFTITGASAGAVYIGNGASATFRNCIVEDNSTTWVGGGFYIDESFDSLIIGCRIRRNSAYWGGGVIFYFSDGRLVNCIIDDNEADGGGGIYLIDYSEPRIHNCTITNNVATVPGGGIDCSDSESPIIANCIVRDNLPSDIHESAYSSATIVYSNIGGSWRGIGNIDAEPKFRSVVGYDYVLWPGSPSIDTGAGLDDGVDWCSIHPIYCLYNSPAPDMGCYGGPLNGVWEP